jgi:ATP-dependent DNA helicase RecQ
VTGSTPTERRREVVRRWKLADLDIVVATAAFGLGVDQRDVRAIVHACVPESVDRFYQEVGRGGRDGKASLSLVVYTDQDLGVARRMSRKKLIGREKGPKRWERMFYHKEVKLVDKGLYRVPVGISPGVTATRIDMVNARNLAWNINTLTLLSRAGVLQMDAERPPQQDGNDRHAAERVAEHRGRLKAHREHRVVRILNPRHLEMETWQRLVEPVRREAYQNSQFDLSRMHAVLQGQRCVAQILADAYRIQTAAGPVHVVPSCGGCSACRSCGQLPYAGPLPEPLPTWSISRDMGAPLARLLADSDAIAVFYNEVEQYDFERFLRWLVSMGIRSAVLPSEMPASLRFVALDVLGAPMERPVFISDAYHFRKAPRVPTLILHSSGIEVPTRYLPSTDGSGIPRVLFLPVDATDPNGPHRHLRDVVPRKFGFSEFLLSQGL